MTRWGWYLTLMGALAGLGATCDALAPSDYDRYSTASGLLIGQGDVDEGRASFVRLECHSCHTVSGMTFPAPPTPIPERVLLGGEVEALPSDGYLATAIINPDHELAEGQKREVVSSRGISRMADFSDIITLRELRDVVAFLHTRYEVAREP